MKRISILGVTGSIGTQTLDVLRFHKEDFELVGITANRNIELTLDIIKEFSPKYVAINHEESYKKLVDLVKSEGLKCEVIYGMEGLVKVATLDEIDIVVTSVVGMIGLKPTVEAIRKGKDIALANKETLVVAGELVMREAKENGVKILPVDSEHSAIFQSLQGNAHNKIDKILLTASGGPFRGFTIEDLKSVTPERALKHPKWNMGQKISIDSSTQQDVDYIVEVEEIGDPNGIASGATRFTKDPKELLIAKYASAVIEASGYLKDGFSIQAGTGGASLAVARFLKEKMEEKNIKASFGLGGISKQFVDLHEEGFIGTLFDVQGFDLKAVESIGKNNKHVEIDASLYANPHNKGCIANKLDIVILSALEVDKNFNVNVITGSDGYIRGASGGHSDTAAGAKLSMIVSPLVRGRIPTIVEKVNTVITPGESIDVIVTERGVAINDKLSKNKELKERLESNKNIPILSIEELHEKALKITGTPEPIKYEDRVVGIVEYRDGSIIDVIHKVKED